MSINEITEFAMFTVPPMCFDVLSTNTHILVFILKDGTSTDFIGLITRMNT